MNAINYEQTSLYIFYFIVVVLTNWFFSIFSKKTDSAGKQFMLVMLPTWGIITTIKMISDYIYLPYYKIYFDIKIFIGLLAQSLPIVLIFGGIAFFFKYRKFKNPIK